jgi:tetratricopeptide (TPR) repeat protein
VKSLTSKPGYAKIQVSSLQPETVLRETIERQRAAGIPLGHIMDSLDQIYDQAQKRASHTLKQLRVSSPNFDGIVALHQDQMAWVQYIGQERARLFGIMAERNDSGKASERQGQLAEAVALYEANVEDRFSGSFAYDRLRIIYTRQGQYADAIRVCQAYLDLPDRPHGQNKEHFQHHLEKLVEKEGAKSREK